MKDNLDKADYPLIITSWAQCLSGAAEILHGLPMIDLGHQELPRNYANFYRNSHDPFALQSRMISGSKKAKAIMKIHILRFILMHNLLPSLVYFSSCSRLLEELEEYIEGLLLYYRFIVGESFGVCDSTFWAKRGVGGPTFHDFSPNRYGDYERHDGYGCEFG